MSNSWCGPGATQIHLTMDERSCGQHASHQWYPGNLFDFLALARRTILPHSLLEQHTVFSMLGHLSLNTCLPDMIIEALLLSPNLRQMSLHTCVAKKNLKPSLPRLVSASLNRLGSSVWMAGSVSTWPTPCRSLTKKRP